MALSAAQRTEIEGVIKALVDATAAGGARRRRQLAEMFLDLVDRESWPEYYEVRDY